MRRHCCWILTLLSLPGPFLAEAAPAAPPAVEKLTEHLEVVRGPVNGGIIRRGGKTLVVYGDPRANVSSADMVLFTHHRRDVVWAGRALVDGGATPVVPEAEIAHFTGVETFWSEFETKRFQDSAQQTTKILTRSIREPRTVSGGDVLEWEGLEFRVLDTPGYTRGAVSYLVELDGNRVAFTGDCILAGGKIPDLYSMQDAIREAGIGGYHGYAARLGALLPALERIAAAEPDLIVPARGPVIRKPRQAVDSLVGKIRAFYRNYLSIDALRWYFKDDHIRAKAKRVLEPDAEVEWMPMAEIQEELPGWIIAIANSRLILAEDGCGFLIDCGGRNILEAVKKLREEGRLKTLEHVFITHYHSDHTNQVSTLVELYQPTVHASRESRDILEQPGAYRLPVVTENPIHVSGRGPQGLPWRWKEFEITLYHFPGQTIYHDALLVRRDGGETVFFIGDSFTPAGIDDYCLLNRNFLHEGMGYFYCLEFLKRKTPDALLINQHVKPLFRFTPGRIDFMIDALKARVELLRPLFPWDDPNWGLDEGWARFYPYGSTLRPGEVGTLLVKLFNHSPKEQVFRIRPRLPAGWALKSLTPHPLRVPPRKEGAVKVLFTVPETADPALHVITADILWSDHELREWTEALVRVSTGE